MRPPGSKALCLSHLSIGARSHRIRCGARFIYPEGVTSQSPGSRSAPWVNGDKPTSTPKGLYQLAIDPKSMEPLRGTSATAFRQPRVRCATLGFGIQPLRGKVECGPATLGTPCKQTPDPLPCTCRAAGCDGPARVQSYFLAWPQVALDLLPSVSDRR